MDCVNAVGKSQLRLYRRHVLCFCQTQSSGGNEEKDTGSGLCRPLHPHLLLPSLSVPTRLTECGRPSSRWSVLPVLMRMSVIRSTMQWGSETPPTNRCLCFPHAMVRKHCCYIEAGNSGEKCGGLCCVYSTVLYLCLVLYINAVWSAVSHLTNLNHIFAQHFIQSSSWPFRIYSAILYGQIKPHLLLMLMVDPWGVWSTVQSYTHQI